jgi:hypothetical protein
MYIENTKYLQSLTWHYTFCVAHGVNSRYNRRWLDNLQTLKPITDMVKKWSKSSCRTSAFCPQFLGHLWGFIAYYIASDSSPGIY